MPALVRGRPIETAATTAAAAAAPAHHHLRDDSLGGGEDVTSAGAGTKGAVVRWEAEAWSTTVCASAEGLTGSVGS